MWATKRISKIPLAMDRSRPCRLLFSSVKLMMDKRWAAAIPIVDFSADGKVDIEDLKVFIAEWEKENAPAQP